jgi:hypothetical protein
MSYPSKLELKAELKKVCASDELCDVLAAQFGGVAVNCNHRVPQMAAAKAQSATSASDQDVEKAAVLLCSYVDSELCETKK